MAEENKLLQMIPRMGDLQHAWLLLRMPRAAITCITCFWPAIAPRIGRSSSWNIHTVPARSTFTNCCTNGSAKLISERTYAPTTVDILSVTYLLYETSNARFQIRAYGMVPSGGGPFSEGLGLQ